MTSSPARLAIIAGIAVATGAVASCGSADDDTAVGDELTVELAADEYSFRADAAIEISEGDQVTFVVRNEGELDHRLEVLSSASRSLGATEDIPPGARREVTVTFDEAGVYRVICDIDDHLSRGQQARFEVADA